MRDTFEAASFIVPIHGFVKSKLTLKTISKEAHQTRLSDFEQSTLVPTSKTSAGGGKFDDGVGIHGHRHVDELHVAEHDQSYLMGQRADDPMKSEASI